GIGLSECRTAKSAKVAKVGGDREHLAERLEPLFLFLACLTLSLPNRGVVKNLVTLAVHELENPERRGHMKVRLCDPGIHPGLPEHLQLTGFHDAEIRPVNADSPGKAGF